MATNFLLLKQRVNMKIENAFIMQEAKESLKGKWSLVVGATFVYLALVIGIQLIPHVGKVLSILIGGPFMLGISIFFLRVSRKAEESFDQIFWGFTYIGTAIGAYLLMFLYILLWTLLLIVPGIIAAISYSMTFYILADDPSVGVVEALRRSREMMYGYKWKYFYLSLRFLGWILVSILTLGIGFLWVLPYMQVAGATFYNKLKAAQEVEIDTMD